MSTEGGPAVPLDVLRRRVYRPGATADDVARYEAALAEARPARAAPRPDDPPDHPPDDRLADRPGARVDEVGGADGLAGGSDARVDGFAGRPGAEEGEAATRTMPEPAPLMRSGPLTRTDRLARTTQPARSPHSRRRRGLIGGGAVLAVLLAVVVAITQALPSTRPAPVPSPVALGVGDAARAAFISGLAQGGSAGLGFYLDSHPAARPAALATATQSDTIEVIGAGTRTLPLEPPSRSPGDGGRATVLLVLAADAQASWSAYRLAIDANRTVHLKRAARRGGQQLAGVPTTGTFSFRPGQRPLRLRVVAPAGVRWDVAIVFTD